MSEVKILKMGHSLLNQQVELQEKCARVNVSIIVDIRNRIPPTGLDFHS